MESWLRTLSQTLRKAGLNIDWFPTNFIPKDGTLYYTDYKCNRYMNQWSFENWGVHYWSRTPEFDSYAGGRGDLISTKD